MKKLIFVALFFAIMLISCGNGTDPEADITSVNISTNWLAMTDSETKAISATAFDGAAQVSATFSWSSSNESAATVSNGIVTGRGAGTALITASCGDIVSEPCTVFVADEWIVYSSSEGLRMITPENTRDMAIPGTFAAKGPLLWRDDGVVYAAKAQFTFSYLYFRPFDGSESEFVFSGLIEPIYDLRESPTGRILMTKYLAYAMFSFPSAENLGSNINEYVDFVMSNVDIREFDVAPSGGYFIDATTHTGPRMIFISSTGAPGDTLLLSNGKCPRFSPDGSRIAYGSTGRLWVADATTLEKSELLSEGSSIDGLSWSPDGARIAMCVRNTLGNYELWLGDAATGAKQKLTSAQSSDEKFFPQWLD